MEHRLLMAEDGWKRLRNSSGNKHRTCQIRPHELLRYYITNHIYIFKIPIIKLKFLNLGADLLR